MQVYSLVSSAKCHSGDFAQLPPSHRTCSFVSHLNFLREHTARLSFSAHGTVQTHRSLHCSIRYSLTPGSRECMCEQSALPRSTTSEHIQRSRGSNPRSLACMSRTLPLSYDAPQCLCLCFTIKKWQCQW